MNILRSNLVLSGYAAIMSIIAYFVFPLWSLMVIAWFIIGLSIIHKSLYHKLTQKDQKLFIYTLYLYPLFETLLKVFINNNVIPYSWVYLNRLEHAAFTVALSVLLFPLFIDGLKKLPLWYFLIFYPAIVIVIGNLNEIFEYIIRVFASNQSIWAIYYTDTIIDITVNFVAAYLGVFILKRLKFYFNIRKS